MPTSYECDCWIKQLVRAERERVIAAIENLPIDEMIGPDERSYECVRVDEMLAVFDLLRGES